MAQTPLGNLLGIKYPVIQAPMAGGIITPEFVSQVSGFGMLGSIPSGYLQLHHIESFLTTVTRQTVNPFQLNIFVDYEEYAHKPVQKPDEIIQIEQNLGIAKAQSFSMPSLPSFAEILDLVIKYKVPVISTTFGVPGDEDLRRIKDNNIILLITVNSMKEALAAISDYEADAVVYQNALAGGHKGGFLDTDYSSAADIISIKTSSPDAIFVKSGGITNRKDIDDAFRQGFDGVQIGTGFLMTKESAASPLHKEAIIKTNSPEDIVSTQYVTGKPATGVKNKLTLLSHHSSLIYPQLHYATVDLRASAKKAKNKEYQSFWAGKGAPAINKVQKLTDYMQSLV